MAIFRRKIHLVVVLAAALSFIGFGLVPAAAAPTFHTIYSFNGVLHDGFSPEGGLAIDGSGNLFGTTYGGGSTNYGTVYELSPNGSTWNYQVLYSFCSAGCSNDGSSPQAAVVVDVNGNLWGTTSAGGAHGHGLIFKLHNSGSSWMLTDMYDFCPTPDANGYCDDGDNNNGFAGAGLSYAGAASGSLYDGTSKLYGVTALGGTANFGVVFRFNPGGSPAYKVLYQFCTTFGNCADGAVPLGAVTVDSSGNLFGTTSERGAADGALGTVYELTSGSPYWSETTLYTFCCSGLAYRPNQGGVPEAGLIFDASGNILGTTTRGGSYNNRSDGAGVEFKLTPSSVITVNKFCKDVSDLDCTNNGSFPANGAGMVRDASSNLYGEVTGDGTLPDVGRIFKISAATGSLSTIYTFCPSGTCTSTDGKKPNGGLVADSSGNFYGTTENGGANSGGTIFKITP